VLWNESESGDHARAPTDQAWRYEARDGSHNSGKYEKRNRKSK